MQVGFYRVAVVLQQDTTNITQNNIPHSNKTRHKTSQTIKDTLHIMNTLQVQLKLLQLIKKISILYTK
jgi:hypothetical protein